VLLSDSRDVVFQSDPFAIAPKTVLSGQEDLSIGDSHCNAQWIEESYGPQTLQQIKNLPVACSGVQIGPRKAMLAYLRRMCEEAVRLAPKVAFRVGFDQGIHNWLLRCGDCSELAAEPNGSPVIATLAACEQRRYQLQGGRLFFPQEQTYPAIVHQYDRDPSLASSIQQLWT
jgi:hypothetical protein